jgi:uncharacterized protein (TIGR00255 family)
MTAFARSAVQKDWGHAIWEIRSVNHRYLDISFKIPDNFREWEIPWRNVLTEFLHRGKVECQLQFFPSAQTAPQLHINTNLVDQLMSNAKVVGEYAEVNSSLSAMEILRWPQVLVGHAPDIAHLQTPLTQLLKTGMEDLLKTREREGAQIKAVLQSKLQRIEEQVAIASAKLPECLQTQKQKLIQKLQDVQASLDPQRLEQELVFYAQRIDVAEELERLQIHIQETVRTLTGNAAIGRRLDFLMQEMNREANTLAAKAAQNEISQAALELKVLIEQMREQIQNVE